MEKKKETLEAKGLTISVYTEDYKNDYISLTDIAKYKNKDAPAQVINNWFRNHDTIEYLGLWESINNNNFNLFEFEKFKNESGANAFTLSPKQWIEKTNAIGITSSSGRYGGTYAHSDIAMEFASWISPEFKLYVIQDYQRLKADENSKLSLDWNVKRSISKMNYKIHTDAIKEFLLADLTEAQKNFKYADEADLLNVALFGMTAKEWRIKHNKTKGNMRDEASIEELIALANLESYNAILISKGIEQGERLEELRNSAKQQLKSLLNLNAKETFEKIKALPNIKS